MDNTKRLEHHEELINTLKLYSNIRILHIVGDPPNTYEIEFKSFSPGKNETIADQEGTAHTLLFKIPEDYPLSSPGITTKSTKVNRHLLNELNKINALWPSIRCLSNLVIHVGMIILSQSNTEKNNYANLAREKQPVDDHLYVKDDASAPQTRKENDKIKKLITLIKQKMYFSANILLADIQNSLKGNEYKKFEQIIGEHILKANELHRIIQNRLDANDLDGAKKIYIKLANTTPDFPALTTLKTKFAPSQSPRSGLSLENPSSDEIPSSSVPDDEDQDFPLIETNKLKDEKKNIRPSTRSHGGFHYLRFFALTLLIVMLAFIGTLYYRDKLALERADQEWKSATVLVDELKHKEALEHFERAKNSLTTINLLFLIRRERIKQIDDFIVSQDFIEGLHGRILYKGKYLAIDKVEKLKTLNIMRQHADQLARDKSMKEAIAAYEEVRLYATANATESNISEIQQIINNLRLELTLSEAKKAEGKKQWDDLTDIYQRALTLAKQISEQTKSKTLENSIHQRLAFAIFKQNLSKSREKFADQQWNETINLLEIAQEALSQWPSAVSKKEKTELETLLNRSRLYSTLSEAKAAYESEQWNLAADKYHATLKLLKKSTGMEQEQSNDFIEKVKRTLLMAELAELLSEAAKAENQNNFPLAIKYYNTVIQLAETSDYRQTGWARNIITNTYSQIEASKDQHDTNKKISWLTENYSSIFRDNLKLSHASKLLYPSVTYEGEIDKDKLFQITCIEKNSGKPARLIIHYQYVATTGLWRLHPGQ
ncbi:MAG: hypothetical protein OEV64_03630 [Desulfobulbaceae bacterium]|nr:hypothetical protein [Desulfobulbaceae bacterium]